MKQSRTVRFDMDNENDVKAFNILKSLKDGQGNQFIINAILNHDRQTTELSIDDIRQVLREELQSVSLAAANGAPNPPPQQPQPKTTEQIKGDDFSNEENDKDVTESLNKAINFISAL